MVNLISYHTVSFVEIYGPDDISVETTENNGGIYFDRYPLVIEHSYWKWLFIVDFPIKNCDFP